MSCSWPSPLPLQCHFPDISSETGVLLFLMVPQEFAPWAPLSFIREPGMGSCFHSLHFSIGRTCVCFQYCISMFYFHQREDGVTSSFCVKNDDCVHNHVISPSLVWFLWLLQHWGWARVAMTDCLVAKQRRRVLFVCGRESGYTGGKGMEFL